MIMTKTFRVPAVLMAGLAAACGQGVANTEDDTAQAPAAQVTQKVDGGADVRGNIAGTPNIPPAGASEAPGAEVVAPIISALPLKRGFYVLTGTACDQASAATLFLLAGDSIGGAQDSCTFRKIEKTGTSTYRVTESCSGGVEQSTSTYTIRDEISFTTQSERGHEVSARFCAQSSLPDPWRDNDISDITG